MISQSVLALLFRNIPDLDGGVPRRCRDLELQSHSLAENPYANLSDNIESA